MGLEALDLEPGAVTLISGKNGSGKSSIVEGFKYLCASGHDPSVIKKGAEAAEVKFETDDGTVIRVRVTQKSTTRDIRDAQGRKITKTAEYLHSIIESLTLDPAAFLRLNEKGQVQAFLEAVQMRVSADDLRFVPVRFLAGKDLDQHALQVIGDKSRGVYKDLYEERTAANRKAKESRVYADQLRKTLPDSPPEGNWDERLQSLTEERLDLQTATTATTNLIRLRISAKLTTESRDVVHRRSEATLVVNNRLHVDNIRQERPTSERSPSSSPFFFVRRA
jgi:hypothetical protein